MKLALLFALNYKQTTIFCTGFVLEVKIFEAVAIGCSACSSDL